MFIYRRNLICINSFVTKLLKKVTMLLNLLLYQLITINIFNTSNNTVEIVDKQKLFKNTVTFIYLVILLPHSLQICSN